MNTKVLTTLTLMFSAGAMAVALAQAPTTRQVSVDSLVYDLEHPDPLRRKEAVTQLGINKVQRTTPDLVPLATDPDASVRRALVIALAQVGDIRALPGFVTLTADVERDIRDKALEGLTNLYLPQEAGLVVTVNKVANFFNPWSDEWADIAIEPDLTVAPTALSAVTARLQDPDGGIRAKAARSLGILRAGDAAALLLTTVREDESDGARFEAVRALRKIGDRSVAGALVPLVPINAPRVRNEIVFTIGRLRYVEAVPELTRRLDSELAASRREADRSYQLRLAGALAFIASSESKPTFERLRTSSDADLRRTAYEGLARLRSPASPEDVTRIASARLAEKDAKVRLAQDFTLYRMGRREHLGELVKALGSRRTNDQAREYLLDFEPAELAALYGYATDANVDVAEALAEILGLIGDQSAVPTLQNLARDTRGQVSALATQALHRVQSRRTIG